MQELEENAILLISGGTLAYDAGYVAGAWVESHIVDIVPWLVPAL